MRGATRLKPPLKVARKEEKNLSSTGGSLPPVGGMAISFKAPGGSMGMAASSALGLGLLGL